MHGAVLCLSCSAPAKKPLGVHTARCATLKVMSSGTAAAQDDAARLARLKSASAALATEDDVHNASAENETLRMARAEKAEKASRARAAAAEAAAAEAERKTNKLAGSPGKEQVRHFASHLAKFMPAQRRSVRLRAQVLWVMPGLGKRLLWCRQAAGG